MTIERKELKLTQTKLLAAADGMEISGYLAKYGNVDQGYDLITPGAFAESLADIKSSEEWPPMLLHHGAWGMGTDDYLPIGLYTDLSEDENGLKFTGKLAETTRGKDVYTLLKMSPRPAIKGMSIGYIAQKYRYSPHPTQENAEIRVIEQAKLIEGSIVTFPMNREAMITDIKSQSGQWDPRKLESALCEALGFSRRQAKALLAKGFQGLASSRDVEDTDGLLRAFRFNITTIKGNHNG